jgi:hypothetical protein
MPLSPNVKQKLIGVTALLIIFTILGSVVVLGRPQNPDWVAYEAQTQKIFADAKTQFERIRNVTLPADINIYVYTKQQAIDRWGKDHTSSDTKSILRQETIYKSLFLMDETDSLEGAAAEWIASWIAAALDNNIYVIYENFQPWNLPNAEATLIHELTHIWQDSLSAPTSYDTNQAHNALTEGDASYMSDYYKTQYNTPAASAVVVELNLPAIIDVLNLNSAYPSVPDTVTELNWFPYIQGKTFVSTIVDTAGWNRLNLCYTPLYTPSTTKQIIHPDKYFAGEPAKTNLAPTPADKSWSIIPSSYGYNSDTYGEYFIYVMLNRWLNESQAQQAATGWGGDNFTYYEKNKDFLFTWNITWDSIQDACEFNQAFLGLLNITQTNPQDNNTWFTNGRYLTLTWNPNTEATLIVCSTNPDIGDPSFFT